MHLKLIFFAMRSADLTWDRQRIKGPVGVIRKLLFRIDLWVFIKNLQEIKLFICHFSFISLAQNTIEKHETTTTERRIFRNTSDGLFPILELKLKCCFCTCSIKLLFILVFITCHSRILQCAALFLLLVPWMQLKLLMNKVCLHLFVYGFIFSLKKMSLSKIWKTSPLF